MGKKTVFGVQVLFQNEALYDAAGGNRIAAMKAHIDSAAELGVGMIRFPGDWRALQPESAGSFSQYYVDEVLATIAHAKAQGISIVMTFAQTPFWATSGKGDPNSQAAIWAPPTGAAAKAYADALVLLHDKIEAAGLLDAVKGWEIWNEPNTTTFWPTANLRAGTDVQVDLAAAKDYVALLNTAYDALKATDAKAVVLGGALAACDAGYLNAMYAAGAKFDALALHPYTKANPFNGGKSYAPDETAAGDALSQVWSFKAGVNHMRDVMVAHGDAGKAMWFTEFGWSSTKAWGGAGSAAAQAAFLDEALHIIDGWDFVDAAIAYRLFDGQGEEFGMRAADGTLKAAGEALKTFLAGHLANAAAPVIKGLTDLKATATASFEKAPAAIDASLADINGLYVKAGLTSGQTFKHLAGSAFADTLKGDAGANVIDGKSGNDRIEGGAGNDVIRGSAGDNWLFGGAGNDQISGGDNCDWIEGGAGADVITGGGYHGHALYWSSKAGVAVNLTSGVNSGGDAQGDKLSGIKAVDGSRFGDQLTGSFEDNWLTGLGGGDYLRGLGGKDRIDGGAGNDYILGGHGADLLIGGAGADRFDFDRITDSGLTTALRDQITDFARGQDKIDLSTLDANVRVAGNQAFTWIGANAFHQRAGELHTIRTAGGLFVEGDINGDGRADFQIEVKALAALAAADFVL
ncbi:MAG: cellulase family glycosylhydrolase [Hyphomicrobium sp.]|nr:cellulase family glycosylhydrolase [Hyphomicrobium sp.]